MQFILQKKQKSSLLRTATGSPNYFNAILGKLACCLILCIVLLIPKGAEAQCSFNVHGSQLGYDSVIPDCNSTLYYLPHGKGLDFYVYQGDNYNVSACSYNDPAAWDREFSLYNYFSQGLITYDDDGCGNRNPVFNYTATFTGWVRLTITRRAFCNYYNSNNGTYVNIARTSPTPAAPNVYSSLYTVCSGTSVYLTCSANTNGGSLFYWYDANDNYIGSGSGFYHTPTGSGSYRYRCRNYNTCQNASTDGFVYVTVNPTPAAPNVYSSASSVCSGTSVYFSCSANTNGGSLFYWYDPNGTYIGSGTGFYTTVTVPGNYRCRNYNTCQNVYTDALVYVTVNPTPAVYSITGGGGYCAGSSGVAIGLNGSETGVSYQLQNGGVNTGSPVSGTGGAISFGGQTAVGTYRVIATRCTSITMFGERTVSVNALPVVANPSISVCQGATPTSGFYNPPSGNALLFTFTGNTDLQPTYNRPDAFAQGGSCVNSSIGTAVHYTTHSFTAPATGSYTFSMCGTASAWNSFLTLYQNSFNPSGGCAGNTAIAANDDAACGNFSTLTVNLTAGTHYILVVSGYGNASLGAYTLTATKNSTYTEWYTAGGSLITSNSPFSPVNEAGSGITNTNTPGTTTFYAQYSGSSGCRTPVTFTINPTPTAGITSTIPNCGTANLTATGGGSYAWSGGATPTTAANTFSTNGTYTVTVNVTSAAGCSAAATTMVTVVPYPGGTTLYVDAAIAASGNGTTFAQAYKTLDEALLVTHNCTAITRINVASGTYKPTKKPYNNGVEMLTADTRDITFHVRDGVSIYGGYDATTGLRGAAAASILSGDIGTVGNNTDNCYHVVLSSGGTGVTIDGFTVTGGNANGGGTSITINGNAFRRDFGGGIFIYNGTNTLGNNTLYSNSGVFAAAVYAFYGTSIITNNSIYSNYASAYGGGILAEVGSHNFINNTIYNNSATYAAGGVYTASGTHTFTNNTFYNNSAGYAGGLLTETGTNNLTNNIFWQNKSGTDATAQGADYRSSNNSIATFKNNILQLASSNYPVSNTGTFAIGAAASGNIFATNPLFVNAADPDGADNIHRTADDGLSLASNSPAINAGSATATAPTTDITGATRGVVPFDLGAYEYYTCPGATTIYVNAGIAASGNGISFAQAYKTLDEALFAAHNCPAIMRINVASGTYKPTKKPYNNGIEMLTADTRDITFHVRDGVSIYGGYDATTGLRGATAASILSGDIGTVGNNADNCYHVVLASAASSGGVGVTIDGFTVTDGNNGNVFTTTTVNGNDIYRHFGGGILTYGGANIITNNAIYGNTGGVGGGISSNAGTNTIANNTIYANTGGLGGGISTRLFSTNTITNNTIYNNTASNGGGIFTYGGPNTITNNILWDNKIGTNAMVASADYYADGTNGNTFKNNILQLASSNYPISNSGTFAIGAAASGNIFANDPLFVNAADPDGADNIDRTADDGLRLACTSPAYNTGTNTNAPTLDILGNAIFATTKDIGAYESQADLTPTTASITGATTACGSASLTATGGASYTWSGGASTTTAINTFSASGTYTVTATSSGGCTATATTAVTVYTIPTAAVTETLSICGSVSLTATGGASYAWNDGASMTTAANTFSASGNYTVTVTSTDGCTASTSAAVIVNTIPTPTITGATTACGSASLTAAGGASYLWSDAANTATAANTFSASGTYTVTVTSAEGCTATATAAVVVNMIPTAAVTETLSICGSVSLMATGGVSYAWNGGTNPTADVNTFSSSGNYIVTVTSADGCTATASADVMVNTIPTATITGSAMACGTVSLTATGGVSYAWNDGTSTATDVNTFSASGNYTVTVTSTAGCTASASAAITVNTLPTPTITGAAIACETVSLTATGGANYAWNGGTTPTTDTNTFNASGNYMVTVTSADGCTATASTDITINTIPTAVITDAGILCGDASLTATGGASYAWNGGASPTTDVNTFSASGNYTVTVTSAAGCTATASAAVTVNANPTVTITGATTSINILTLTASGGSTYTWLPADSQPSNTASHLFTDLGTYTVTVTVTSAAGCTTTATTVITVNPCSTTPTAYTVTGGGTYCVNGLGRPVGLSNSEVNVNYQLYNDGDLRGTPVAGTGAAFNFPNQTDFGVYTVVGTNTQTGCVFNVTGSVTMSQGAVPPVAIAGATNACNSVNLTAYGGTSYAWSGGAPANTAAVSLSASGTYTVTVTGADGCTATATRVITVNPLSGAAIAMVIGCNSATLTASGGTTYSWSGGNAPTAAVNTISASGTYNVTVTNNSGCSATVSQIVNMPNVTGAVFGALSGCGTVVLTANTIPGATYTWSSGATPNAISNAVSTTGIYTVTITINSCSVSTTRSVTVYGLPNATVVSENASCNSGSSVLTATGGTTYTWASGLSTTTAVNTVNGSGTYTVTVSNGNGCSATASFTVNAIPSPQIAGNTTSCGSIALNAYYGNSYLWSGGTSTNTAANTVTSGGTYTVTATSAAGCTATASITVAINPAPIVTITGNSTGCGNAIMTASGGNSYLWSSGFTPTTAVNTVTNAGNYTVTVTDANGCTAASTFAVTAVNTAVNPIIKGNSYGCTSTILTATGGNTYVWSGGVASTTPGVATFNTSGTYTVTITRTAGGCTATASRVVTIGGAVQAQIATSNNATCSSLTLTASGGSTYAWSNGGTGASKLNVASGTYTVTATTATCGTGTASITVNTTAVIATITSPATACGNASLTATGGISYAWSNNTVAATNNVLNGGTYTVTATAANGCTASATKAITIGNAYAAISGLNTACGTLTLTASGGTTYAWTGGGTTAAKAITASGTYTVTVTSSTCTATASKTVTILAKPTVTMAASAIGCGRATLTVTPLPAAVYTYTWASGRNTTATATNVVATGGTYNVTVTNANGCTAATNLLVTIPSVTAGIAGVSSTCGSITLTAYSNGGTPAYAWTGGTATAIKTITANGTYTVTVTATFPSGVCSATASQTVTLKPAATASIAASATTACNSLNLTASGGGYYAWSGGIAPTSAVNTIITSSTYTVTVTNSAGCTATSTKAVVINTPPTAGITGVTTACSQVQLTAAGNFGSTYAWSGGGTTAAKIITTNGIYTVTVTQGACGTATASRTVTINTPPTMVSIAEISIVANATTLSATSTGGVYYAWNSGYTPTAAVNTVYISATYVVTVTNINGCSATASLGVIISPIDPFLIAPTTHGNIPQSNTIENSKNDATASSTAIAAINNITPSNMVSVYPNPITDDVLQVKINLSSEETVAKIDFIDLYGKLIATQTMTLKQGENTLEFNVKNLTAGIYFVKTTATGQEFETKKVLKMRH